MLKIFSVVTEMRSITCAAVRLDWVTSNITIRIQQLETNT